MPDDKKDSKAILTEAIRKRDELNIFIRMYQEMLGISDPTLMEGPSSAAQPNDLPPGNGVWFDPLSVVYPGMFFGQSQPKAVKLLLERVKSRPLKTKTLVECLEKGGLKVGGKKPTVNLWGVLDRSEDFILVPKAGWGLAEWYEPSVIAKYRKEGSKDAEEKEEAKEESA